MILTRFSVACLLAVVGWLGQVFCGLASDASAPSRKELHRAAVDAFFTNGTIVHLTIEASPQAIESLRSQPREYVAVTLREGAILYSNVAVHLKGGSGSFRRVDDRPGFTIDFNRYQKGGRFHGLKKIHLNNGAQDPTRLSELIGGQMFREAGVPAARAAHALVELNGRRLGLYVAMEAMDDEFLSRHFADETGNLYGQTRGCDVTQQIGRMEGDQALTYEDLKALAAAVLEPDPKVRLEKMQQTLDLEKFISFMAMEVMLGHWDGYTYNRHNYRIYHDPGTGRMSFIPHDLDQLMRRGNQGFLVMPNGLVAQAVMNTPELRARYQERIGSLTTNVFVVPRLTNRVDRAVASLLPTIQAYDTNIAVLFTSWAAEFKNRIAARGAILQRKIEIMNGRVPALAFKDDNAKLTDWHAEGGRPTVQLARTNSAGNKSALWMKVAGPSTVLASWRTQVLLEPGCYRLEGLVRCSGVVSQRERKASGAGLIVPGYRQMDAFRLTGDYLWQKLGTVFEVSGRDDVELVCELRAEQGEAWFAEDSLQLVRLPPDTLARLAPGERKPRKALRNVQSEAMQAIRTAALAISKEPKRPAFHFHPPAQWMGDVCGAFNYQGRYHLFYQFNPWTNALGLGAGWGHARSRDLVRWEYLPPALLPDEQNGSILDGTGSAVLDGSGKSILFYAHTPEGYPKNKAQQWAALPQDENLLRWRRQDIGLAPGKSGVPPGLSASWGDMFVWRSGGRAFATFQESKGLVCEALDPALAQWKALGRMSGLVSERPNFFPLDGRYMLINSTCPISYYVGDFDTNRIVFRCRDKQARILDYGAGNKNQSKDNGLYGTTVFTDEKNRTLLLGAIGGFTTNQAWNGVMSLPRMLQFKGDQLIQEPIPELALLRVGRPAFLKNLALTNAARVLETVRGDLMEVSAEIKPGTAKAFGLRLRGGPAGPEAVVIRYSAGVLNVAGSEVPYPQSPGQAFTCRFFFDRSVLEAFIDSGRIAVTRVVYPSSSDLRLEVFAEDGTIQVPQMEAWGMRPVL